MALQHEPVQEEEHRGQEEQTDPSLEKDAVIVSALVPAQRDELETAVADEPDEVLKHVFTHATIVACPLRSARRDTWQASSSGETAPFGRNRVIRDRR